MTPGSVLGRVEVSPRAIASLASDAVLRCYGVVGMAASTVRDGIAEVLQVENSHRGVQVNAKDGQVTVDLYVVIEYGIRISEVAQNVMDSVKFTVERALGMPVAEVNVHVQGVRISPEQ
ncbi:MAG: Asp23/Gls24 family envelope stress response protein [Chloroflexi bacterium]|nr:Asp23/Gls24 family envelope stress response protein [Chloroflexota bacterium]